MAFIFENLLTFALIALLNLVPGKTMFNGVVSSIEGVLRF